ncbi:hypothetical protein KM427_16540 [Nocardioides sp. LMS-CY]|uniref:hypothetical protein n=1 Tax=Nocardioides sp. (strain LMS-CY) TaxID=2840457 RepID=UPI001C005D06|nr:hypothetical protein [Nocardioides sp. LMS-CY]QWF20583.1 hypothetical protein KM427_16540 [Nocardioides sp. LMS-CY]
MITGPDGRGYARHGTRTGRRAADELVAAGVPIVLDLYGHGQLEWFDAEDARTAWTEVRPFVTTAEPTSRQLAKHVMWTAGTWLSEDEGPLLYLTGRC